MTTPVRFRTCLVMLAIVGFSLVSPGSAAAQAEDRGRGQEDRRNITCSSAGGYQRCDAPNG